MKDEELQEKIKKVLSIHAKFLTAWLNDSVPNPLGPVTLEDYEANEYGPRSVLRTHDEGADFDILTLWVNPFQDEGGPMVLVAFYEMEREEPTWILQHFDGDGMMIWKNGDKVKENWP